MMAFMICVNDLEIVSGLKQRPTGDATAEAS